MVQHLNQFMQFQLKYLFIKVLNAYALYRAPTLFGAK